MTLDNPLELSPDLEWLLPGVQASETLILQALVTELLDSVFHLAFSIIDDPLLAEQATVQTFVNVIQERHRYHGAEGVKAFIFRDVLLVCKRANKLSFQENQKSPAGKGCFEIKPVLRKQPEGDIPFWRAYAALGPRLQIPLLLEIVHGLTLQEIGLVTKIPQQRLEARLHHAKARLIQAVGVSPESPTAEQTLHDLLNQRWPPMPISENGGECMLEEVQKRLSREKQLDQSRKRYIQVASVSVAVVFLIALGWITNRFSSQVTRSPFTAYTVVVTEVIRVPVYITQTPQPEITEQALTVTSDIDKIRQRILSSHQSWRTLWAEALIYQYGPIGYVGPPVIKREQVWIDDTGNSLLLSGKAEGSVDEVWLSVRGKYYIDDSERHLIISGPGQNLLSVESVNLRRLFPPDEWLRPGLDLNVVGKFKTIGRDALILDVITQDGHPVERLWVDAHTGVIIGLRLYDQDGITVLMDIYLTELVMNVEFPDGIFNPGQVRLEFSKDYLALESDRDIPQQLSTTHRLPGHEPYPRIDPPESFDPSQSFVSFQWRDIPVEEIDTPTVVPVDVFGDGYYLGEMGIGNPWNSTCERSSDGKYLAIVEQPDKPPFPAARIQLLNLSDLEAIYEPLPVGSIYGDDLAFSPNSDYLAFWGCGGSEDNCGVYKLDLNTQKLVKLLPARYARYFVWSPDGNELAMLSYDDRFVVVNSITGHVTYEGHFNRANTDIFFGSKAADEGLDSLVGRKGLLGCKQPGER